MRLLLSVISAADVTKYNLVGHSRRVEFLLGFLFWGRFFGGFFVGFVCVCMFLVGFFLYVLFCLFLLFFKGSGRGRA